MTTPTPLKSIPCHEAQRLNAELRQLARLGSLSRTKKTLLAGADPLSTDEEGRTALLEAVASTSDKHRLAIVKLLLPVSDPTATSQQGDSPLTLAIAGQRLDCVALLLPHVNVDMPLGRWGQRTVLTLTVQTRNASLLRLALNSANPDIQLPSQDNALSTAIRFGFAEGVKLLLEKCDLAKNHTTATPLAHLALSQPQEILDLVLDALAHAGCSLRLPNKEGQSPFVYAAHIGSLTGMRAIFARAKPSAQEMSKALMVAILQTKGRDVLTENRAEVIEFLCIGRDFDTKNCERRTPAKFAELHDCRGAAAIIATLATRDAERFILEQASASAPPERKKLRM